jgi:Flp pilus assembly protein TadD
LKYRPEDWGILVNRGDAKKELRRIDEAILDYDKAMKLSSNSPY